MEGLIITKLTPNLCKQASEVMAEAYKEEEIISNLIDLNDGITKRLYAKIHEVWLNEFIKAGQPPVVSIIDGSVVGLAVLRGTGFNITLKRLISVFLPRILTLLFLGKLRITRLYRISKLLRPPIDIVNYYSLEAIAVHPKWQGRGIGRILLEEVYSVSSRNNNLKGIYLYTAGYKNQAIYNRLGYNTVKTASNNSLEVYHMILEID